MKMSMKAARINSGKTQSDAAKEIGVTQQTLSNWETGRTYPSVYNLIKMSEVYGISVDSFLLQLQSN